MSQVFITHESETQLIVQLQLDDGRWICIDIGGPSNREPLPKVEGEQTMCVRGYAQGVFGGVPA